MRSQSPPCPNCSSRGTIESFERFGRHVYFCMECERSWSSRDRQTPGAIRNQGGDGNEFNPSSSSQG